MTIPLSIQRGFETIGFARLKLIIKIGILESVTGDNGHS